MHFECDFDAGLYSADAIIRAAHRQSSDCEVELNRIGDVFRVRLTPAPGCSINDVRKRLMTDVLDESLRERVSIQTSSLRDILIEAAMREARPISQ